MENFLEYRNEFINIVLDVGFGLDYHPIVLLPTKVYSLSHQYLY